MVLATWCIGRRVGDARGHVNADPTAVGISRGSDRRAVPSCDCVSSPAPLLIGQLECRDLPYLG